MYCPHTLADRSWCACTWSCSTDERSWSLPAEFNTLLRRFGEWAEYWDETSQHCFYYNLMTQEQSWEPPAFMVDDDTGEVTVTTVDLSGTTHAGTGNGVGGAVDDGTPVKGAGIGASANSVDDNGAGSSGAGAGAGAGARNALASTGRSSRRLPVVTKTTKDTKEDIKFRSRRYQLLWNARKLGTRYARGVAPVVACCWLLRVCWLHLLTSHASRAVAPSTDTPIVAGPVASLSPCAVMPWCSTRSWRWGGSRCVQRMAVVYTCCHTPLLIRDSHTPFRCANDTVAPTTTTATTTAHIVPRV